MRNDMQSSRAAFATRWMMIFLVLSVGFACSKRETPAADATTPPRATAARPAAKDTVLYVTLTLGNPFYEEMISGLREGLQGSNWALELRSGAKPEDASGQRDVMEAFLVQHQRGEIRLRGLVLVPANSEMELTETIRRYNAAGVPVVNVDIPISDNALTRSGAKVVCFIGSNNVLGGEKAAEVLAAKVPKGGDVLILMGASGSANTRDRRDGFMKGIDAASKASGAKYDVREWTANWKKAEAIAATDSLLGGGASLAGIFAENDLMALGAAEAVERARLGSRPKPVIVGYDAIPDAVKAVQDGTIYATISQNPAVMGKRSIEYLRRIAAGESVPSREIIPVEAVTRK